MESLVSVYYDDVVKGSAKEVNARKGIMCSTLLPDGDTAGWLG